MSRLDRLSSLQKQQILILRSESALLDDQLVRVKEEMVESRQSSSDANCRKIYSKPSNANNNPNRKGRSSGTSHNSTAHDVAREDGEVWRYAKSPIGASMKARKREART